MMKTLILKYSTDISNNKCNIFGNNLPICILNFLKEHIQPIILKLTTTLFSANQRT
jgi:hypothetical protein